jgi:hypothetical protein
MMPMVGDEYADGVCDVTDLTLFWRMLHMLEMP